MHNIQKPEALLYRIITLFTNPNDLILDPFGGTMTTAYIAKKTNRNFLMIEKENKYIEFGLKRLENVRSHFGDIEKAVFDIKPLKITSKKWLKKNYLA